MARAAMKKDTWWNTVRVEHNIPVVQIAKELGGSRSKWGHFFSGYKVPSTEEITALCKMFDVDVEEGRAKFLEAHSRWLAEKCLQEKKASGERGDKGLTHRCRVIRNHLKPKATEPSMEPANVQIPWSQLPVEKRYELLRFKSRLFGMVYGKVDYLDFLRFTISLTDGSDPVRLIYGKVSYEDFKKIFHEIAEWRLLTCQIDLRGMDK